MAVIVLTEKQKVFVWKIICNAMHPDDREPHNVVKDSYGGDWHAYLLEMAEWHNIKFCHACKQGIIVGDAGRKTFNGYCQVCNDYWGFSKTSKNTSASV